MSSLAVPDSIVTEILLRLPVKPLFRCKCVCKAWKALISEPSFQNEHRNLSSETYRLDNLIIKYFAGTAPKLDLYSGQELASINFTGEISVDDLHMIGSCNGVVCFSTLPKLRRSGGFRLVLWNPSTDQKFTVPTNPHTHKSDQIRFGFVATSSNDFKIVNIVYNRVGALVIGSSVQVYSLAANSWTDVGAAYPKRTSAGVDEEQVVVDGSPHWISKNKYRTKIIVAFNVMDNKFKKMAMPDSGRSRTVANLGGCLAVVAETADQDFEVWVMKEYGVAGSWTKLFSVARPEGAIGCCYKASWRNRVVFQWVDRESGARLAWYDDEKKRFVSILMADSSRQMQVIGYVESMVSVESLVPNPNRSSDQDIPTGTDWYVSGLVSMGVYY